MRKEGCNQAGITSSSEDGFPPHPHASTEQAAKLIREGKEVLIITRSSGSWPSENEKTTNLRQSMHDIMIDRKEETARQAKVSYSSACAAGQMGLMSLYETMFNHLDSHQLLYSL